MDGVKVALGNRATRSVALKTGNNALKTGKLGEPWYICN